MTNDECQTEETADDDDENEDEDDQATRLRYGDNGREQPGPTGRKELAGGVSPRNSGN